MSRVAAIAVEAAPPPEPGARVLLDGLPGGPWTTVVDGRDDDLLSLAAPRLGGKVARLPMRRPFLVVYSHREVPCEVDAELVGGPAADGADPYLARVTGAPRRMQRRRAVRVPVNLTAIAGGEEGAGPVRGIAENVSAGGALLRVPDAVAPGTTLDLRVECGPAGPLDVRGRVVRCDPAGGDRLPWRAGIAFVDLERADEDRLVRFVFERQRELRARDAGLT